MEQSAYKFFASIRRFLAVSPGRLSFDVVMEDFINRWIIPGLERELTHEESTSEQERIAEEIEMWAKYAKPGTSQSNSWNKEAAKVLVSTARKSRMTDAQIEDLGQLTAGEFFRQPRAQKNLENFRVSDGPQGLMKLFKGMVHSLSLDLIRKQFRDNQDNVSLQTPTDDGTELMETIPSNLDLMEMDEIRKDMVRWMRPKMKKDTQYLFNLWMDEVDRGKDPDRVNWSKDIVPEWMEETGNGASAVQRHKRAIHELMIKYLKDVQGMDLSPRQLKNLKMGAEGLARKWWRRAFATWVLDLHDQNRAIS